MSGNASAAVDARPVSGKTRVTERILLQSFFDSPTTNVFGFWWYRRNQNFR
jgi:hypothetical protein